MTQLREKLLTHFEEIWERYPRKDGKKAARRHFMASVKTADDWFRINAALTNYLKSATYLAGFVKQGSTWFNNWEDWVTPTGSMMNGPQPMRTRSETSYRPSGEPHALRDILSRAAANDDSNIMGTKPK